MSDHASGLANRFKSAMGAEQARQRAAEDAALGAEAAKVAQEVAMSAAWKSLVDDLAVLAAEVGVLSVVRHGDSATITGNGARNVRFTKSSEGVYAEIAGVRNGLVFQDDTWAIVIDGERRPFWDDGAVYVLVEGLGLPMPVSEEREPAVEVVAPPVMPAPAVAASTPDVPTVLTAMPDDHHAAAPHEPTPAKKASNAPPGSALKELKPLW